MDPVPPIAEGAQLHHHRLVPGLGAHRTVVGHGQDALGVAQQGLGREEADQLGVARQPAPLERLGHSPADRLLGLHGREARQPLPGLAELVVRALHLRLEAAEPGVGLVLEEDVGRQQQQHRQGEQGPALGGRYPFGSNFGCVASVAACAVRSDAALRASERRGPRPRSDAASRFRLARPKKDENTKMLKLGKLSPQSSVLLVCDVQERFRDVIHQFPAVVRASKFLVDGCLALQVPVVATEQYPKALGATVAELGQPFPRFAKMTFSMVVPELEAAVGAGKQDYILCGIEAQVCVLQTALDLLERGKTVHVVVDAVSSSRALDRAVALQRLQAAGALLTSAESVLFQLLGSAQHPAFKQVSALAKEYGKQPSTL
ncbi:hypothetical protein BASA81_009800 [Batrachochytrium salamandrivorans]|nr:hypothetical protein BASA81_009800 [Batrachochytrium salamandrivorans]